MSLEHVMAVRGRTARVDPAAVVQHCVNADVLRLDLDAEWEGLDVSVVFAREGETPVEVPYGTKPVNVPWRLLAEPGALWAVAVGRRVSGGTTSEQVCSARLDRPMRVVPSGEVCGTVPGPDPPDEGAGLRMAVPVVEGGVLSWRVGTSGDELPAPADLRGTQVLTGEGAPAIGGRVGDLYIDSETGLYYRYGEKKES